MSKPNEMFLEAVKWFAGTDDPNSREYEEAKLVLEGKSSEKKEYLNSMIKEISKWSKSGEKRNQEIFDTKGDITKFDPDIKDVIDALSHPTVATNDIQGRSTEAGGSFAGGETEYSSKIAISYIRDIRSIYAHFLLHKKLYMDAFKSNNETAKAVYVAGTWLLISYTSAICAMLMYKTNLLGIHKIDAKYGSMVESFYKVITHPKYVEYLNTAEGSVLNTESILYESAIAIGSAVVALVVTLRLIMWNIYTMRTKLSDKLRVSAEFLEKNSKRIGNTDRKNAAKIAENQKLASIKLAKMADKIMIKMDDDEYTRPAAPAKPSAPSTPSKKEDDDDMDIEL